MHKGSPCNKLDNSSINPFQEDNKYIKQLHPSIKLQNSYALSTCLHAGNVDRFYMSKIGKFLFTEYIISTELTRITYINQISFFFFSLLHQLHRRMLINVWRNIEWKISSRFIKAATEDNWFWSLGYTLVVNGKLWIIGSLSYSNPWNELQSSNKCD